MRIQIRLASAGLAATLVLAGCAASGTQAIAPTATRSASAPDATSSPTAGPEAGTPDAASSSPLVGDPATLVWRPLHECPDVAVIEDAIGVTSLHLTRGVNGCDYSTSSPIARFSVYNVTDSDIYDAENAEGVERADQPAFGPDAHELHTLTENSANGKMISGCRLIVPLNTGEVIGTKDLMVFRWLETEVVRTAVPMTDVCADAARLLEAVSVRVVKTQREVAPFKVDCSRDHRVQAADLQKYFRSVFVDYPEWTDSPDFSRIARPIWDELKSCSSSYAHDVLWAMGTPPDAGDTFAKWLE